jgi:hypothetical protein
MKLTTDNKQRISIAISFILEFYKVLMGTFLTVFVPQKCDDDVCSITQNIQNTSLLHFSSNVMNVVTFLCVLWFYYVELKRENWSIKFLDIEPSKPNNNLDSEIELYPEIKTNMIFLNRQYLRVTYIAISMISINFVLSGVSIGYDYAGTNTLTSIISFLLLVATKLHTAYSIANHSVKDERIFSAYMKEPKTYNTIDEDFRKSIGGSFVSRVSEDDLQITIESNEDIECDNENETHLESQPGQLVQEEQPDQQEQVVQVNQ